MSVKSRSSKRNLSISREKCLIGDECKNADFWSEFIMALYRMLGVSALVLQLVYGVLAPIIKVNCLYYGFS